MTAPPHLHVVSATTALAAMRAPRGRRPLCVDRRDDLVDAGLPEDVVCSRRGERFGPAQAEPSLPAKPTSPAFEDGAGSVKLHSILDPYRTKG